MGGKEKTGGVERGAEDGSRKTEGGRAEAMKEEEGKDGEGRND